MDVREELLLLEPIERLRSAFEAGHTRPLRERLRLLRSLEWALEAYEPLILEALREDLGKGATEAYATEIGLLRQEIAYLRRRLPFWMLPRWKWGGRIQQPGWGWVRREPYGLVLVLAPWNFPVLLSLLPLVGALAAGNVVALKASEQAPRSAAVLRRMLESALPPDRVAVFEGGPEVGRALLKFRWDYIFFTGGTRIGRLVYEAAARQLTPCTLELGGKSPCVVGGEVDLAVTARRIVWGKFLNAGQVCLAPDYVLVEQRLYRDLLEALVSAIRDLYGEDPRRHPDYGRIVSEAHFDRLVGYLGQGRIYYGGRHDRAERYLEPTILVDVPDEAPVMEEEIFGPILPVRPFAHLEELLSLLRARPDPLALYVFSRNSDFVRRVFDRVRSGGGCVNDVVLHLASPRFPFGGVGSSGLGRYRGRASWETFTYPRSVLWKPFWPDLSVRYPPYSRLKSALLRRVLG
jgi:aldehyde dehydrogenase (NAD+)